MPPKSNIELGSGQLYIQGLDEPFEVHDCEVTDETEWADDNEYIKFSQEPIELTLDNVERPRDWTLAECKYCGYKFPVSEWYAMLLGTTGWTCPSCVFDKAVQDARKRSK